MELSEVYGRLERIRHLAEVEKDDEAAHGRQDALYVAVLEHHAAQGDELAREALRVGEIKFGRWYA